MRRLVLFMLLSLSIGPGGTAPPGQTPASARVLVLGDSLSAGYGIDPHAGWVSLMQQRMDADELPFEVVNSSISGDTTRGGLARLPDALDRFQPRVVLLELGANDGLRGFSPREIRTNLNGLIRLAKNRGADVVLIGIRLPLNYGSAYRDQFETVFREVAAEQQVPLVPSLLAPLEHRPELFQDDGVHPSAAAQPLILDTIWPQVEPLLTPLNEAPASNHH